MLITLYDKRDAMRKDELMNVFLEGAIENEADSELKNALKDLDILFGF